MENIQLIQEVFTTLGYPLLSEEDNHKAVPINVYYRNNPDGSVRWVWPVSQHRPQVLRFYNTASRRARILAAIIRLLFFLRLSGLFASGKATLYLRSGHLAQLEERYGRNWALFTGTAGLNRSALLYASDLFHKIPLGEYALPLLINEYRQHRHWKNFRFAHTEIAAASLRGIVLTQKDISGNGKRSEYLTSLHWNTIRELSETNLCTLPLKVIPQWKELDEKLDSIENKRHPMVPPGLVKKLRMLKASLDPDAMVTAGYAHGDFTPWNIYVKKDKLALIDWEMADTSTPLLFDALHFIYQQGVLVEHCTYRTLKAKIIKQLEHPEATQFIREHGIDTGLHHCLYILFTAVYYCSRYSEQDEWQPQLQWSVQAWSHAVDDFLVQRSVLRPRQALITGIIDFLHTKPYAALKWMAADPASLSEESDMDICIAPAMRKPVQRFLKNHFLVVKQRRSRKSYMDNYGIWLADHSFLSVDMIFQLKRRHTVMMDTAPLIASATMDGAGVKVPAPEYDFTYTWLFYLLNHASMPVKYRQHFSFRSITQARMLNEGFAWKEQLHIRNYRELFYYDAGIRSKVMASLSALPVNKSWRQWRNRILFILDSMRGWISRRGFIITFSGVDGAGKSTVIEKVRQQIEKRYRRKTVVLRHRPAVLPMLSAWKEGKQAAEQRAATRLPRQGNNNNLFSSLLRFGYYYADYLAGQFVVQVKYVWRGYVVLYDRYYFDFIQDGKRSNIVLPYWLTRSWYALLLKPSYNFFLYAEAETILQRKKELDKRTILELTRNYLRLFGRLGKTYRHSKYIAIRNEQLPETLQTIFEHIKAKTV